MTDAATIHRKLESARRDLLDLTTRNRLLSTPRTSTRSGRLEIVDERAEEVFRILITEGQAMTFLPKPGDEDPVGDGNIHLFQPEEETPDDDDDDLAEHHVDLHLQTTLTDENLQKRLLKLYYDARTSEEEQGVNILYLAVGFLKWFEADNSDRERHAPLLLIPVQLDRRSASSRFRLKYSEDEIATNLSLQEKLKADFGLQLPDVPAIEDLSLSGYFAEVARAVETKPRWEVLPNDMVLWLFSFAKFLMYRDLQPDTWPEERQLEDQKLVTCLLSDGFGSDPPICSEEDNLDEILQPRDMIHVMDADSSQALAIEEVRKCRNLVIQGPPGTGKSQTIANLIATAVKDGRKVLFVAEKMAALEVVKRRLDNVGVGDMCLELHSHKSNKRAVLEELSRTLKLGRPRVGNVARQAEDLTLCRDSLNRHAQILHSYIEPARVTPFQALGELVRLRRMGVKPVDFELVDCLSWPAPDRRARQNLLTDLAIHLREIGVPKEHPWRGVQLDAMIPSDVDRVTAEIPPILERVRRLASAAQQLAEAVQLPPPQTALDVSRIAVIGKRLMQAPDMDRTAISDAIWAERRHEIGDLVGLGKTLEESRQSLSDIIVDVAWTTDVSQARRGLAAHGRSWLRFLNRNYREAQATLRGILAGPPPKPLQERIKILDDLIRAQNALKEIDSESSTQDIGRCAFGSFWRGQRSDWAALEAIADWEQKCRDEGLPDTMRQIAAVANADAIEPLVRQIGEDLKPLLAELQALADRLTLDLQVAFSVSDPKRVPLQELAARLAAWQGHPEGITKWIAYRIRRLKLDAEGMGQLADRLDDGLIASDEALDCFLMAYYEALMREAFRRYPELAEFDGVSHEQVLLAFKRLDLERLLLARQEVALAHFEGLPTQGGEVGEIGILRKQMKMKRRHLPVRKLLQQAGHAVQAIKPVFMMSPISIAQYLQPGVLEFDLLVFDEASQVKPVDALGAVARARQVVVVGDDRQLPPTRFFSYVAGDDGDEAADADDFQTADVESVLGLCEAQNMPQRMLRWHYRSRHHSLIAVSNHEFYNDRLYVVPSPTNGKGADGLQFRHIPQGVFDRGGSATNRVEAEAVADAVMRHAREYPDKTLGVGAFSVAQRDAILDELELRRREAPELEPFFATGAEEPFFVKNLENIQGDERAVIFISVGYGKDSSGFMAMNFGPLNNDGGERRLNVLITRARERCEVYSSITADDIDLNRTGARGARALKTFLTYARTGFLDIGEQTGKEFDSEFEREVARALTNGGYEVHAQVGVAGFFVDLAVVDPDCPGRYLLGIECDGASYHSSRSARDRDRLRQQVLEDRGWIIHRIWSTDWFHRPDEQLRKTIAAIEEAKVDWASRQDANGESILPDQAPAPGADGIQRHEVDLEADGDEQGPVDSVPYREASFQVRTSKEIHEVSPDQLARVVTKIVEIEGPVHQDEIGRRTASLWGLQRAGSRIANAVEEALACATHAGAVIQSGLYFQPANQKTVPIRNRSDVSSKNLRKPDYLPSAEIRAAMQAVIAGHLGIALDELTREVARLLGFRATSSQLRQLLDEEARLLVGAGGIESRNGKLYAVVGQARAVTT